MMITGARQILEGFSACEIEPLNLPQHYARSLSGYIVISSYNLPGVFDLVFLSQSAVCRCVRMDNGFRSTQTLETVCDRLHDRRNQSLASLYEIPHAAMQMFLSTFYNLPRLKFPAHLLSAKQVEGLLLWSRTERGIMEIDRLTNAPPSIELFEFASFQELLKNAATVKEGHVFLYSFDGPGGQLTRPDDAVCSPPGGECSHEVFPRPTDTGVLCAHSIQVSPTGALSTSPDEVPGEHGDRPEEVALSRQAPGEPPARVSTGRQSGTAGEADYVRLLDHMFRAFRKEAHICLGRSLEGVINMAVRDVRLTFPEFDLSHLSPATVLGVFDLMEKTLEMGSVLRRAKLRACTLRLLEDLYNGNFDILEANGAVERLEELYYRLKK